MIEAKYTDDKQLTHKTHGEGYVLRAWLIHSEIPVKGAIGKYYLGVLTA